MKIWTKICGVTRAEDAVAAARAGADAIGINFWSGSVRFCEPERAREIAAAVAGEVEVYGVFVDEKPEKIVELSRSIELTGVQLHGKETPDDVERVRAAIGAGAKLIRAAAVTSREAVAKALDGALVWRVLLDNPRGGGTGARFDERLVAGLDLSDAIVAGGLTPANVRAVVESLQPFGVDTAGGVESARGIKDHTKIREFIDHAHAGAA